jgi:endonuclease/exonuclease/phosphatase family metal-dependent hydrolase
MALARIHQAPLYPYVISTHFTTLLGEHEREGRMNLKASEEARIMRWRQAQRLLDVTTKHLLEKGELVFLMGDLNATPSELCMSGLVGSEGNFVRLLPENPMPTHPKVSEPVDHILIHVGKQRVEYRCWIMEDTQAKQASDHLPVMADIKIYAENSPRYEELGPGVIREET